MLIELSGTHSKLDATTISDELKIAKHGRFHKQAIREFQLSRCFCFIFKMLLYQIRQSTSFTQLVSAYFFFYIVEEKEKEKENKYTEKQNLNLLFPSFNFLQGFFDSILEIFQQLTCDSNAVFFPKALNFEMTKSIHVSDHFTVNFCTITCG